MTALDLYDHLHARAKLAQVPAIMITADPLCGEIKRALAERNITLLEKPFGLDELFQCIEQTMQLKSMIAWNVKAELFSNETAGRGIHRRIQNKSGELTNPHNTFHTQHQTT